MEGGGNEGLCERESPNEEIKCNDSNKEMKAIRVRPNFFLAVQITNEEIRKKVKSLQEKAVADYPILKSALINISTLHITLAVTRLENEKETGSVINMLDEWAANEENKFVEPLLLNFQCVKTFGDTVAYVDIEKCQNYNRICKLSNELNDLLSHNGFMTDNRSFKPHLTIIKLSRDYNLLKSKHKFKEALKSLKQNVDQFGKQEVNILQLLSMDEEKDENGYYKCFHQLSMNDNKCNLTLKT